MASQSERNERPNVDKIILELLEAIKEWEELDFRDLSLWETFQEKFEGYTKDDFKSANKNHLRKLRDFLRKQGVWILKQSRTSIAKSLTRTLLEEEATQWTEEEVRLCYDNEKFTSNLIDSLFETDFGRSPRMYGPTFKPPFIAPSTTSGELRGSIVGSPTPNSLATGPRGPITRQLASYFIPELTLSSPAATTFFAAPATPVVPAASATPATSASFDAPAVSAAPAASVSSAVLAASASPAALAASVSPTAFSSSAPVASISSAAPAISAAPVVPTASGLASSSAPAISISPAAPAVCATPAVPNAKLDVDYPCFGGVDRSILPIGLIIVDTPTGLVELHIFKASSHLPLPPPRPPPLPPPTPGPRQSQARHFSS